jgi:hypothetical protein
LIHKEGKKKTEYIEYIKRTTNALPFYGCTFIAQRSATRFGQACGHLQGGENNNTNTFKNQIAFVKLHS